MGGLAHYLEAEGIATTQISLIREHTAAMKPPRALWVPFELGRPLGTPDDRAFQMRVIRTALQLLEAPTGPVLVDFPDDAPVAAGDRTGDTHEEVWVCPVSFPAPAELHRTDLEACVAREIGELAPWYDLAVERRGRSTMGVSGMAPGAAADFLAQFLTDSPPTESPVEGRKLHDAVKQASDDLKAYYLEAATARPGTPGSVVLGDWFWDETAAGRLFRVLKSVLAKADDRMLKLVGVALLVPGVRAKPAG